MCVCVCVCVCVLEWGGEGILEALNWPFLSFSFSWGNWASETSNWHVLDCHEETMMSCYASTVVVIDCVLFFVGFFGVCVCVCVHMCASTSRL